MWLISVFMRDFFSIYGYDLVGRWGEWVVFLGIWVKG